MCVCWLRSEAMNLATIYFGGTFSEKQRKIRDAQMEKIEPRWREFEI